MELNFKDDLLKFNSDHAKLLYITFYFYKHQELNSRQKLTLKSLIILEDEKIFDLLDEFEKSYNHKKLLKDFIQICKSTGHSEVHIETPKKKNKVDYSFSQKIKKNILKNSSDSSSKIFGSKLSGHKNKSFLNKTTIGCDSKVKSKFSNMGDCKIEEFSLDKKYPKNFNFSNHKSNNKIQNININPIKTKDQPDNVNIILINNNGLYQYSPLNRAYHTISLRAKSDD